MTSGVYLPLLMSDSKGAKYIKFPALTAMSTPNSKWTHGLFLLTVLES